MSNDEKVLALFISLYKEVVDAKAKAMLALQKLEPSFTEQIEFSHEYRTTIKNEMQKAALMLKELGFSQDTVDSQLTTLFGDIMNRKPERV
jgi:membrane-bound lytic murein transglycosylase